VLSIKSMAQKVVPTSIVEASRRYRFALPIAKQYTSFFAAGVGLEIGGPTGSFLYSIPIYFYVKSLDGVNFSNTTVWTGDVSGDRYDFYPRKAGKKYIIGKQHIMEASDLSPLDSGSYDFLLSSNCLEHVANPLKALREWTRVIRKGGHILLVLPKKEHNFDHRRSVTPFEHLLDDFRNGTTEHDLTHLDEILTLHDLSMDLLAGDRANFRTRSERNFENRCLHHHVFDADSIRKMLKFVGVSVIREDVALGNYIALGEK
jgi:SAM-dependent methyltransferase